MLASAAGALEPRVELAAVCLEKPRRLDLHPWADVVEGGANVVSEACQTLRAPPSCAERVAET